jgi:hypothetical protein
MVPGEDTRRRTAVGYGPRVSWMYEAAEKRSRLGMSEAVDIDMLDRM